MNKTMKIMGCALIAACAVSMTSQAALLAYEGFNTNAPVGSNFASTTSPGTYTTDMTGFGFASYTLTTGSWKWDYENGQGYTDGSANTLENAGRSIGELETFGNTRTIAFNLADPITSGTTYVSFLFKTAGLNSWGLEVGMDQGFIRSSGTGAMQFYDPSGASPISTAFGTSTHLVVLKMDLDNNNTTVWVDPSDLTDIQDSPGNFTTKDWSSSATGLNNFWVQAGGDDTIGVDEIRIGTTLEDVVAIPEPATLGLIAGAGASLLFIRRLIMM